MSTGVLLPAALIGLAATMVACGKAEDGTVPMQVAATVNGDEIPAHQVNSAVARMANLTPDDMKRAGAGVLERYIDQELLVQKALEAKLDRDPQVMRSMESAKRQILAQAYLEKTTGEALRPGTEEVEAFYQRNSALFAKRRIYRVEELSVILPRARTSDLEAEVAKAKSLNDVVRWLKGQQLPFHMASATRAAEHVPLRLLQRLAEMKDGQIIVFPAPHGASVVHLVQSQAAPLTEDQARPAIERFLVNRKRLVLAEAAVKNLRAGARIEYGGEFEATRPVAGTQVAAPAPGAGSNARGDDESIARGVVGLK